MRRNPFFLAATVAVLAAVFDGSPAAFAQAPGTTPGHGTMQHGSGAAAPGGGTPDEHGDMMAAMERMNRTMMDPANMTGNPDQDLVSMMIPHHQGAIDMAHIYLRTGRDPQIRRMVTKIIADQEREIREMRAWQARHPAPAR